MKYMGSKNRIAKHILPIILRERAEGQFYVEPFVGGANLIDKVTGPRIGGDVNKSLILALELIRDDLGALPETDWGIDEYLYGELRNAGDSGLRGYYGFALSYGGKWFGGWRRDKAGVRDYVQEAYKNAAKQNPGLQGVSFITSPYDELPMPDGSIIYCDPPYTGTTKYKDSFDHNKFWQWVREKSKKNTVFVSEYQAPDDFMSVWEKEQNSSLTQNTGGKKATEKLFTYCNWMF